ncbi:DUF4395 domain-containing protein [Paenibacillus zeisoli]|uniref:DUF4395 domain-containing protein n=1 Tax=Paenibacillus zeisoli TaxID=2496267 RepID=A0A3S1BCI1_9BACL|nr:DUF4395 domain-containing protein [Paenibacillus zeisoli]RUT36319.1 DUF4395 domain-containing protein [Paenibacillus zeisoli]
MKEIPVSYVKANQTGIVLFVILATVFAQPYLLLALWLVQAIGLLTGYNLFVILAKPFLKVHPNHTQAAELTRFNNTLAVIFLTLSLIGFLIQLPGMGYMFAWFLFAAAFAALCGYCIGCTIYFQFKQFKARRRRA